VYAGTRLDSGRTTRERDRLPPAAGGAQNGTMYGDYQVTRHFATIAAPGSAAWPAVRSGVNSKGQGVRRVHSRASANTEARQTNKGARINQSFFPT
jgi:hypothetical protein